MRISVDAHAIGCHLTGNEVYIRNLLQEFARLDEDSELIAYISKEGVKADLPSRIQTRSVSQNPYKRLGLDLPQHLRRDRPDLLHVQYTGPLFSAAPLVVSVHDVSFLEYPQYFTRFRSLQLRLTVRADGKARGSRAHAQRVFTARDSEALPHRRRKGGGGAQRRRQPVPVRSSAKWRARRSSGNSASGGRSC